MGAVSGKKKVIHVLAHSLKRLSVYLFIYL